MSAPHRSSLSSSTELDRLVAQARAFAAASQAASTGRALGSDWRDFDVWCWAHHLVALPAASETVALYLADRASILAPQTLTPRLTAITQAHRATGYQGLSPASMKQPSVGAVLRGIRRVKGVEQHGKDPLLAEQIRALVAPCGEGLQGQRDRALIRVGFASGARRSELVGADVDDLSSCDEGLVLLIRRSKTDQEGGGRRVEFP